MTRDQSITWIEALDAYLEAKRKLRRDEGCYARPGVLKRDRETIAAAREALSESMVPIVTGTSK